MVEIKIDPSQMDRLIRTVGHIQDGVPKVLAPAINRALEKGRTIVKREIRQIYLIKAKDIPINVRRASRSNLSGAVVLKQGMLDLAKFKVVPKGVQRRKVKRPIFAQVKKGGGGTIKHAFVPAGVGYVGPFVRQPGAGRLPIKKLLAIGAPIMASQPTVAPPTIKAIGDTLALRIDHEMQRLLAKG
jgi:hypothetical protein